VKRTNDLSLAWSRLLLATAGAISVGILLFDRLPILFLDLALRLPSDSNALLLFAFKSFVAAIPVLVPTFLMGMFFPLALGMISQYREPVGNSVGMLYMYNTIGSIVGSAIAGFVVIPLLGLQGGLVLCVSLYLFCAWFLLAAEKNERRNSYALFACVGLIGVLLLPTWDSGRMGLGMFRLSRYRSMDYKRAIQTGNVLFYREGVSATVSVEGGNIHRVLKVNGKAEASTVGDRATQISISAIPIAWHRDAQDVAIIGWGSGMTVGAALHFPLRRLDALEIEPAVVAGSKFFEPWNFHPLRDKRLRLIYNDGRNFLATSKQQYDVIISQPSNPWISGVSNLFTREYFELVRRRLRKGGIFCQWVQLYEISDRNVSSILYSLQSVFPYTRLFEVGPLDTDTFIIASMEPQYIDLQHLNKQIKSQRYRELFRQARIVDAHDLLPRFLMGEREIANMHKEFPAPLNTDAYNILEFSTPLDLVKATHDSRWGKVVKAMGRPYQSYLSTDPKSLSVNQRAELLGQVAKAYLRYGDWEQAEKILERAIKLWPELPEQARYRRLVSLMSLLEPEPSLPELSQIKEVLQRTSTQPATPSTPSPRERLSSQIRDYLTGQGFFEKNETDECLYKFEPLTQCADFIRIFPQIWYYMGACSMRKDRYEQAFAYFSRYIREYAIVIPHKSSTQPAPQ
jgi:spermidine synthase